MRRSCVCHTRVFLLHALVPMAANGWTADGAAAAMEIAGLLHAACYRGDLDMVRTLLSWRGPNNECVDPSAGDSRVLRVAARRNFVHIVHELLRWQGPPALRVNPAADCNEALIAACKLGHTDVAAALLGWRGEVAVCIPWFSRIVSPCSQDHIAMKVAVQRNHVGVVLLLVDWYADKEQHEAAMCSRCTIYRGGAAQWTSRGLPGFLGPVPTCLVAATWLEEAVIKSSALGNADTAHTLLVKYAVMYPWPDGGRELFVESLKLLLMTNTSKKWIRRVLEWTSPQGLSAGGALLAELHYTFSSMPRRAARQCVLVLEEYGRWTDTRRAWIAAVACFI